MDPTDSHGSQHPLLQSDAEEPWEALAVALPAKIYKSVMLAVAYNFPIIGCLRCCIHLQKEECIQTARDALYSKRRWLTE